MTDSITIQALGEHPNVATEFSGSTPLLAGYSVGAVPLDLQQKGSPVDVGEYSALRLELGVSELSNRYGVNAESDTRSGALLFVTVEHSSDEKTWEPLVEFDNVGPHARLRKVATGFERYVRASWYFCRPGLPTETIRDEVSITWGLTAEALPEIS